MKLTVTDLRAYPVWEYALDEEGQRGQDETWVRPVDCKVIGRETYVIVASDFSTRSGRHLSGFMSVNTMDAKVQIRPGAVVGRTGYRVIPATSRKLAVARKYDWVLRDRDRLVAALGEPEADVFPMRYTLKVMIHGEKQQKEGFLR